jgi:hypothetical protein
LDPPGTVALRTSGLSWGEVVDQIVILDLDESTYLSVSGSGAAVWRLLAKGASIPAIAQELTQIYDVALADATRDVEAFIDDLKARRLLATR